MNNKAIREMLKDMGHELKYCYENIHYEFYMCKCGGIAVRLDEFPRSSGKKAYASHNFTGEMSPGDEWHRIDNVLDLSCDEVEVINRANRRNDTIRYIIE